MNKRALGIILNVIQKKYPFIKDIKYAWRTQIGRGYDEQDHNFTAYVNLNQLKSLFPDMTIDYKYLYENGNLVGTPTMAFNEYDEVENDKLVTYGKECRMMTLTLLKTIVPNHDTYEFAFYIVW